MVQIENTISFAFPNGSPKPTMDKMAKFVKTLDANLADMECMYRIADEKSVFIKFKSVASQRYVMTHNLERLTFRYDSGNAVDVQMLVADGNIQYVRVYDLPPEVPDANLSAVLGRYGKVKHIIREKFPAELGLDMHTGVRGVYMDVEKDIPSSLSFLDMKGNIFYCGNKDKCFVCKAEGHLMNSCPKRKDRKQKKQQQVEERKQEVEKRDQNEDRNEVTSYAGVVAEGTAADTNEEFDEEVMAIDEMNPETEDAEESDQASGSEVQNQKRVKWDYRDNPMYKVAQAIYDETQRQKQEEQNEERKKLQVRNKSKQPSYKKK